MEEETGGGIGVRDGGVEGGWCWEERGENKERDELG